MLDGTFRAGEQKDAGCFSVSPSVMRSCVHVPRIICGSRASQLLMFIRICIAGWHLHPRLVGVKVRYGSLSRSSWSVLHGQCAELRGTYAYDSPHASCREACRMSTVLQTTLQGPGGSLACSCVRHEGAVSGTNPRQTMRPFSWTLLANALVCNFSAWMLRKPS